MRAPRRAGDDRERTPALRLHDGTAERRPRQDVERRPGGDGAEAERRNAEARLRFQLLAEHSSDLIVAVDAESMACRVEAGVRRLALERRISGDGLVTVSERRSGRMKWA